MMLLRILLQKSIAYAHVCMLFYVMVSSKQTPCNTSVTLLMYMYNVFIHTNYHMEENFGEHLIRHNGPQTMLMRFKFGNLNVVHHTLACVNYY